MSLDKIKMTFFHFKMDIQMITDLTELDLFKKTESISGTINRMLLQFFTVIEKEHMFGEQRLGKYELINEDKNVKRLHLTIPMPEFMYRRLKMLHDDLNFFSIAQLLRWLVKGYMNLVKKYGDRWARKLITIVRRWQKTNSNSSYLIKYIHQLIEFDAKLVEIIQNFAIYSLHFSPYRVFRL